MSLLRSRHAIVAAAALTLALASGPGARAAPAPGKVEKIGAFSGAAPDWVKAALEPAGYRATLSDGTVANEVWFRKDVPGLSAGTLVGVITFAKDGKDFRDQTVKAGSYTLRYATIPEDGDHLGASPTPAFVLLVPAADDTEPRDLTFKELAKLSAKTSRSNHPSPMNLADTSAQKEYPAVAGNNMGHEVLFVKLKTPSGSEVPIGLVVKGRTEHE